MGHPVSLHEPEIRTNDIDVYTDASDSGYGIVVVVQGKYLQRAGTWTSLGTDDRPWNMPSWLPHINQRELAAVQLAEKFMADLQIPCHHARLHVDNTTALGVLRRGRSKSYWLNYLLTMQDNNWRSRDYVCTTDNLADKPSRGVWLDE